MRKNVFDEGIITTSHFRKLSKDAQLLYFHLSPDSVGIISDMLPILDSLDMPLNVAQELVVNNFLIDLGDGFYLQKHWHINNNLDYRRLYTRFADKIQHIFVKSNLSYTIHKSKANELYTQRYLDRVKRQMFFEKSESRFTKQQRKKEQEQKRLEEIADTEWLGDKDNE